MRFLVWGIRLALAAIFIFAGLTKLYPTIQQFKFEMAVSAYQLLPEWGVIVVARALPWFEVALGVVLLVGWQLRYAAGTAALLLGAFVTVMALNFARGNEIDCGCFGLGEPISPWTLVRDAFILALAVFLTVRAGRAGRDAPASAG